jgi:hypothetical protein
MYMKKIVFLISIALILAAGTVNAQTVDQRCWTEKDCSYQRQQLQVGLSSAEAKKGFYQDAFTKSVCGDTINFNNKQVEIGFCSPVGQAATLVGFGGQRNFENIAQFIQYIYRYGIMAASILAVVMMIVAGLQWILSGGNTTAIDSAKKKLAGSTMGLVILVLSFTILNTINPYLVNLRLPQVWLINQIELSPSSCADVTLPQRVAEWGKEGQELSDQQRKDKFKQTTSYNTEGKRAECGKQFFVQGTPALSCTGYYCKEGTVCVKNHGEQPAHCTIGSLAGQIRGSSNFLEDRNHIVVDDDLNLIALCYNGQTEKVGAGAVAREITGGEGQFYVFPVLPTNTGSICDGDDGDLLGYYIAAEVNDRSGVLGQGPGIDDWFAIGRSPSESNICNINLSKTVLNLAGLPVNCSSDADDWACGCEGMADLGDFHPAEFKVVREQIKPFLFSELELRNGVTCDLQLDRSEFPDLDATTDTTACAEISFESGRRRVRGGS